MAVQYFWNRGHREVTVFVPTWQLKKNRRVRGEMPSAAQPLHITRLSPLASLPHSLATLPWPGTLSPSSTSVFCVAPESHFLTQLHSLKMLSITPSQLENGKKITTYDYRWAVPQAPPWGWGWSRMVSHLILGGNGDKCHV